ncbi:MAG: efflux RND transporter permease subunit [Sphingobacteriales bacterium]|nr:MAG: efflux RND transporter permease subunit [Sphingobacteriales bacterium]
MNQEPRDPNSGKKDSFLKLFIERPVLSTVISIMIVLLGILGLISLPIAQYPDISPPTVQVSATYPGASADVLLKSVVIPLEEQINGVEGMSYITSSATNNGSATISVYFKVGTDPDMAAVNVQNRVSSATSQLPQEVTQSGVTVRKRQSSTLMIASIYSDNPAYDATFLQNYAEINIIPLLKRVNGVGDASAFGQYQYSMRVWMKPDVMALYGLTPADISTALSQQNVEAAPGKFGENSSQSFQYVIKYSGRLQSIDQFENIIIKASGNGQLLRLKDVARLELGAQDYSSMGVLNGRPSVNIGIYQTPGANARNVINECKKVLNDVEGTYPAGVHNIFLVDVNKFLDASIEQVLHTLAECFILVFIVIFLFLQDFRSTLIPGIAVPVSIIGTFFFLYLFNFSINLLTLFALVLAIGIVVDDAIVVVEAVHTKLEEGYDSARRAAIDAMGEISGAIFSITLVMAAVFVPVAFLGGSAGVFYRQFGITLAIAILISAVNALTLCPALAALFLKPHASHLPESEGGKKPGFMKRFQTGFNAVYDRMLNRYKGAMQFLLKRKGIALIAVLVFGLALFGLMKVTPSSFVPNEDMGTVYVNIMMPPATSLERTTEVSNEIDRIVRTIPGVQNALRMAGRNFMAGNGSSYAMEILQLKLWHERDLTNEDIIAEMRKKTAHIREAKIFPVSAPTITGFGQSGGFEFQLEDKGGHTIDEFYKVSQDFLETLNKRPEIQYAATSFNPGFPQFMLDVNVARCLEAGVDVSSLLRTMQGYYGSIYASNFNQFGKQYRVMIQADTAYRASPEGLSKIFVRTNSGQMAPISSFIALSRVYGPESIARFNLFTAMQVTGSPDPSYSTGQALTAIEEIAAQSLPPGYGYEFSGISREEQQSGSQSAYVFALCLVFVYFILSAQYESYLLPFAVLLSLPVGLAGTFLFIRPFGIDNNIYIQISLIVLIGLLAKNAILIVEFALQRRRHGLSLARAAIEGAEARLRPILMTSFAFIFGLLPLLFASGAGAHGNKSIGAGAIGGMLFGTLLGVFITPVLFVVFQSLQERISGKRPQSEADESEPTEPSLVPQPAA